MGKWLVERRLTKTASRLASLRSELAVIDEQLPYLGDDADDQAIRALVADNTAASREAREAQQHASAMLRHRSSVIEEMVSLERRQDELLDQLTATR